MALPFSLFFRAVKGGIDLRWYADVIPTHTSDACVAFWAQDQATNAFLLIPIVPSVIVNFSVSLLRAAPEGDAMPGVWMEYERDPDVFGNHEFKKDSLYQAEVYDDDLKPLGTALFQTVTSGQWGDWVELHYVACENDYYAYWMNSGEFPVQEEYHICKKGVKHCSCKKAGKPDLVHLSKLRTISPAECLDLKWLKGPAKQKLTVFFEKDDAEVALGSRDEAEVNTPGAGVSVSKAEGLFGDGRGDRIGFATSCASGRLLGDASHVIEAASPPACAHSDFPIGFTATSTVTSNTAEP